MQHSLVHIHQQYLLIKDLSLPERLAFFQKNTTSISNFNNFENTEEINFFTKLSLEHLATLMDKKQFIDVANQANIYLRSLTHNETKKVKSTAQKELYHEILFIKSIADYNLKNYKQALTSFKLLVAEQPENQNFKKWLHTLKHVKYSPVINTAFKISMLVLLIALLVRSYFNSPLFRIIIVLIPLLSLLLTAIFKIYLKNSYQKLNK